MSVKRLKPKGNPLPPPKKPSELSLENLVDIRSDLSRHALLRGVRYLGKALPSNRLMMMRKFTMGLHFNIVTRMGWHIFEILGVRKFWLMGNKNGKIRC